MPYRRLPTTDKARIRAMSEALEKASRNIIINLPFSEYMLDKLMSLKNTFVLAIKHYHQNIQNQNNKKREYNELFEVAAMFLSHYIQTLYMCIERKEMNEKALQFYGLEDFDYKLPSLSNEEELLNWGERILSGDKERVQKGGSNIYNPSIAMVRIKLEEFKDVSIFHGNLVKTTQRSAGQLKKLRITTNDFIAELWDSIEEKIGGETEEEKRKLAEEYGVVYVFRKKELKKKVEQEEITPVNLPQLEIDDVEEKVATDNLSEKFEEPEEQKEELIGFEALLSEPEETVEETFVNNIEQKTLSGFDIKQEPQFFKEPKPIVEKRGKRKVNVPTQSLELAFDFFGN